MVRKDGRKSLAWCVELMIDSLAISAGALGFAGWTLATMSECSNWVDMQLAVEPELPMALNCDDDVVEGRECCG